jgi:hypothetical protein
MTTVNLGKGDDFPRWKATRFAPAVSSTLSAACGADNTHIDSRHGRYIYYLIGAGSFWRYDTWSDSWQQLASPITAPATFSRLKFSGAVGYFSRVLSATTNTITAAAITGEVLLGYDLVITAGTGKGQQRKITNVSEPTVFDYGTLTTATVSLLTDTNKNWAVNSLVGMQVKLLAGTGLNQIRKIIANTATTITLSDANKHAEDILCNPPLAVAPAAGTIYQIETHVITVDSNWLITPDTTSRFKIQSGSVWLASGAAATPFYTLQMYDVAADQWYIKNASGGILPAAATDFDIERCGENASVWQRGIALGTHSTTTLQDTTKDWAVNQFAGKYIRIYSGTGEGQLSLISSNTTNTLTFAAMLAAPTNTSRYMITGFDAGAVTSAATSSGVSTLTDSSKSWATNRWNNLAVEIVSGTGAGQERVITNTTATVLTVSPEWGVIPDSTSRYVIHGNTDTLLLQAGGRSALFLHSVEDDMTVLGRRFEGGAARGVSVQVGEDKPIAVASATYSNPTLTVTTVNPHGYKTGEIVKMRGDTGAGASINNLAGGYACTVTGATTFTLAVGAGSAAVTVTAQSTTTLVDGSKNWTTNQWAGHIVTFNSVQGPAAAVNSARIVSNTATTLTFSAAAAAAPVQGISRYSISAPATHLFKHSVGSMDSGVATGSQSTTTLQDTSKTWPVGAFVGRTLIMLSGTGQYQELAITANTANTLTFATATAPVAGATAYSILQAQAKGTGISLNWIFENSDPLTRGSLLTLPRGGGLASFHRLNMQSDSWLLDSPMPYFETLTTGSMYAYDGGDYIYFTKEVTQRVYRLNVNTWEVEPAGLYPYIPGTAILGNRFEIFETSQGLRYLWLNRHSGQECYVQLLWY